jgi:hypothetical protein
MACGEERAVESRVLVARVEDPAGAGRDGGIDADAEQADPVGAGIVRRDQQDLIGALERVEQRRRVFIGAAPHAYAAVGEVLCFGRVAHAHGAGPQERARAGARRWRR